MRGARIGRLIGPAFVAAVLAQAAPQAGKTPETAESIGERGVSLAQRGRCAEALPLLKQAQKRVQDSDLKRRIGGFGVRCGMTLNRAADATGFLVWLNEQFPHDPEILYMTVRAYSDLSIRASQELLASAPGSAQVHQLNAEALETQGDWQKALEEYRIVLQRAPDTRGIHYRIGRLILSQPPTPTTMTDARREFEAELKIDPESAASEYVLGAIARQEQQLPEAIEHFSRAVKLDDGSVEAQLGLGQSLLDSDRFADAVAPLERAVKLQPENPTIHFLLATAYQRLGRKEDASREFAAHKAASEKARQMQQSIRQGVSAGTVPVTPQP